MDPLFAEDPELLAILGDIIDPQQSVSTEGHLGNSNTTATIDLESNLNNIIDDSELKFVFIGGKGGVGKTTISSSLALALAKCRGLDHNILLVSTDPAHSLSDAFDQNFSTIPTQVENVPNLYVMETDVGNFFKSMKNSDENQENNSAFSGLMSTIVNFPGIDEAIGFKNLMTMVESAAFSCTVFDTAPTGHTLHFLAMPETLASTFTTLSSVTSSFGGIFSMFSNMFGLGEGVNIHEEIEKLIASARHTSEMLSNPDTTQFVCVCTPGKLPLYETERLVQKLSEFNIATRNIVVNQISHNMEHCLTELNALSKNPETSEALKQFISFYKTRFESQQKFLGHIKVLYPPHSINSELVTPFHVTQLPLLSDEVRGVQSLLAFSNRLRGQN